MFSPSTNGILKLIDGKENDIKTEYGEAYDDTAATAALKGRYLLKNGFPAAVTSEGSVDTSKLGNYTITYHASFLFWKGEATKTVHVVDTSSSGNQTCDGS